MKSPLPEFLEMPVITKNTGLYTDHYELAMVQGYFLAGKQDNLAVFDYFFRRNPFGGGYVVFAGLQNLLAALLEFRFDSEDCNYLSALGFHKDFVEYLRQFSFTGSVVSVREGEIVFPYEPVMQVKGEIAVVQLVETILLNYINFESLIATKASRIRMVAGNRQLLDFGLRRAQGLGGIQASRSAIIGGFDKTSNVYSAYTYGLQSAGTMAHSWVQAFGDELTAFRVFAGYFPENCTFLVDTYDTLKSGVPNAITVALEMKGRGQGLSAIRLDSGDLAYLAEKAREMLDAAGLPDVKIVASNQLDEYVIQSLNEQKAPLDAFGVGTSLATAAGDPALDGVYKLAMINDQPTLKVSENISKMTLPGEKSVYRFTDHDNKFYADAIALSSETDFDEILDPFRPGIRSDISGLRKEKLSNLVMDKGKIISPGNEIADIAAYSRQRLEQLPSAHKRFVYPHIYKVGITKELLSLRDALARDYFSRENQRPR